MTRYMQHIEDGTIYVHTAAIEKDARLRMLPPGFDPLTMKAPGNVVAGVDLDLLPAEARAQIEQILAANRPSMAVIADTALPAVIDGFENVPPVAVALPIERALLAPEDPVVDPVDPADPLVDISPDSVTDALTGMNRTDLFEFARLNQIKVSASMNNAEMRQLFRDQLHLGKAA